MSIFIDIIMEIRYITNTGHKCPYEKRPAALRADHLWKAPCRFKSRSLM